MRQNSLTISIVAVTLCEKLLTDGTCDSLHLILSSAQDYCFLGLDLVARLLVCKPKAGRSASTPVTPLQLGDLVYVKSDREKFHAPGGYVIVGTDGKGCFVS